LGLTRLIFFNIFWIWACFCFSQNEEKVVIHTNRNDFIVGEKIYFSASVHDIGNDALSEISSVLYIEIRSAKGLSIDKLRLGIVNGLAHGEIFLDSKFDSDYYYLIAYTKWQKNFKAFSSKCISIINPYSKRTFLVDSTESNTDNIQTRLSYKPENEYSMTINNIKDGTYSIAIVQEYGAKELPTTFHASPKDKSFTYHPETVYANLQGKLAEGQVDNQKVSLSFQSSVAVVVLKDDIPTSSSVDAERKRRTEGWDYTSPTPFLSKVSLQTGFFLKEGEVVCVCVWRERGRTSPDHRLSMRLPGGVC